MEVPPLPLANGPATSGPRESCRGVNWADSPYACINRPWIHELKLFLSLFLNHIQYLSRIDFQQERADSIPSEFGRSRCQSAQSRSPLPIQHAGYCFTNDAVMDDVPAAPGIGKANGNGAAPPEMPAAAIGHELPYVAPSSYLRPKPQSRIAMPESQPFGLLDRDQMQGLVSLYIVLWRARERRRSLRSVPGAAAESLVYGRK